MPIITPSHTAVTLADGSDNRIGETIGTTTTAISMKSRKKPKRKITTITTINCAQKPPGRPVKNSLTISSPPKPRNAAVNMAAPNRMINTIEFVLALSSITPFNVSSILNVRQPDQTTDATKAITATKAKAIPSISMPVSILRTLSEKILVRTPIATIETTARIAG